MNNLIDKLPDLCNLFLLDKSAKITMDISAGVVGNVVRQAEQELSFEEEPAQDVLEVTTPHTGQEVAF